jgi:hypothetical protein
MKSFAIPNIFGNFAVMKKAIVICLILFVASCCTEKACFNTVYPVLQFYVTNDSLTGFTNDQLRNILIIRTAKANFIPIDSFYYFSGSAEFEYPNQHVSVVIDSAFFHEQSVSINLNDYNYLIVIRKANIMDTISGISYTVNQNKVVCNDCFPTGHEYSTQNTIVNFQYYFNSTLVSNMNDSTLIHR